MPAHQKRTGLMDHFEPSKKDLLQDIRMELFLGKTYKVHCSQWPSPHGIDIAQGIGCGDPAEVPWLINHRCKKIHCLNKCQVFPDTDHTCVVRGLPAHQEVRVILRWEVPQYFLQEPWRELAGSTCSLHTFSKPYGFNVVHVIAIYESSYWIDQNHSII